MAQVPEDIGCLNSECIAKDECKRQVIAKNNTAREIHEFGGNASKKCGKFIQKQMKYLLLIFILIFSACSLKNYEKTQTKIVIIKSPQLNFADVAYIRNTDKHVELELFIAGQAIEKFSINHLVCSSYGCMTKSGFNEDFLTGSYPDNILQNILLGHVIYDGLNKVRTRDGFEQYIKDSNVDIIYTVSSSITYFKDTKNKILFKIKDTNR